MKTEKLRLAFDDLCLRPLDDRKVVLVPGLDLPGPDWNHMSVT